MSDFPSMQTTGVPVASGSSACQRPESLSPPGPVQNKHVHVVTEHAQAFLRRVHARQQLHMLLMHGLMLLPLIFSVPTHLQLPPPLAVMFLLLS